MKPYSLLFLLLLLPVISFCQSVDMPSMSYAESHATIITKIAVTHNYTVVTFKHILRGPGDWIELNKSIYLQDANGEEKYPYVKSTGISLRPKRIYANHPNQEVVFNVYFKRVKHGTKAVNVIERARSPIEQMSSNRYFNYYNVSLTESGGLAAMGNRRIKVTDVTLMPPPPVTVTATADPDMPPSPTTVADTTYTNTSSIKNNFDMSSITQSMGPMMGQMYTGMLNAQLKTYSDPAVIDQLARITKNYYDALIKAGFSADAALKIVTSKQLVSTDFGKQ